MSAGPSALRVAYVLLQAPSYSETFITSEIRAVRAAGATVEVFAVRAAGGRPAEARHLAGTLLRHPARLAGQVRALGVSYGARAALAGSHATRLRAEVAAFAPDVVHAHFVNLPAAVAVLLARDLGRPVTATAHAADFLLERNRMALDRRLGQLDHLFVISAATARQLAARAVAMPAIPHSVVRAAFDGELRDPPADRPPGPVRLVTIARLVEKKGISTCLDAVARLHAGGLALRYDIYGDGPLRETLHRQAVARGVDALVTFHGAVAHQVATEALTGADVALLACRPGPDGDLDGIPVFLMEAGSRGVPVVSTVVSGIPELIGETGGWLVPPDDPVALAGAVARIVDDPRDAARRGAALRSRVETEFAPDLQAERLLTTWHRLADRMAPSRVATPWR